VAGARFFSLPTYVLREQVNKPRRTTAWPQRTAAQPETIGACPPPTSRCITYLDNVSLEVLEQAPHKPCEGELDQALHLSVHVAVVDEPHIRRLDMVRRRLHPICGPRFQLKGQGQLSAPKNRSKSFAKRADTISCTQEPAQGLGTRATARAPVNALPQEMPAGPGDLHQRFGLTTSRARGDTSWHTTRTASSVVSRLWHSISVCTFSPMVQSAANASNERQRQARMHFKPPPPRCGDGTPDMRHSLILSFIPFIHQPHTGEEVDERHLVLDVRIAFRIPWTCRQTQRCGTQPWAPILFKRLRRCSIKLARDLAYHDQNVQYLEAKLC
jgi:hypothetical protein